ncbi:MAG TPA: polyamine aminopropyltransferase [Firmicutes bacterium]|nr:polyamine aminopropyltransferase [Bacillota bacterium]
MELWFTENQTNDLKLSCRITRTLHREKTEFQDLAVVDTVEYGRMLVLDGAIQTTVKDEFVYHEMIAHVPMLAHPAPEKVLVIGGGDGGTVREILKHPGVREVTLVEIDRRVIEVSRDLLPETSCGLGDPRVNIRIEDGIKYVKETRRAYDVIIVDSSDPIGPAVGLFSYDFYKAVFEALADDGMFVAQTESPFLNQNLIRQVYADISKAFPVAKLYLAPVPTYPGGLWSFTAGSKVYDPAEPRDVGEKRPEDLETRYYTREVHRAAFVLPPFVAELLRP